jgi:glycosyltransferase involved in cell wall biosynthesis
MTNSGIPAKAGNATRLALFGALLILLGVTTFVLGAIFGVFRLIVGNPALLLEINEIVVWYSALPVVIGLMLVFIELWFFVRPKRDVKTILFNDPLSSKLTAVLTAYNDELSIAAAVKDFQASEFVNRVLVISNNSSDRTMEEAAAAGAIVHNETKQGYGACVFRALSEAAKFEDTELVLLCEGDMTFCAADIPKFLAYIGHGDIVNGTRIVEQLQASGTQISTFIHYGNLAVGKLLELKYLGEATLSDVGTTYKLCRRDSLRKLLPLLDNNINLEFNPYFLEQAIRHGFRVIECPITFYPRVGVSKGGNVSNKVALSVGIKMIIGIVFGWKFIR